MFTSFGQKTTEFYDNHILLTMIFIFFPEFGLKPRYVALHLMGNDLKKKNNLPFWCDMILTVLIVRKDIKLQWEGDLVSKGDDVLKNFSVLDVVQSSFVSHQILAKIYRSLLKECDCHKI